MDVEPAQDGYLDSQSARGPKTPLDAETRQRLTEWARLHWDGVYALLYRLSGGDRHLAEDLTQETFLRAAERRATFAAGSNLRAWLMRIATNAFLDGRRRSQVAKAVPLTEGADLPAASDPSPARGLEGRELEQALGLAIAALPDGARAVFLLRTQQELSFREIAEVIGASEETARWHMLQARRQLMTKLNGTL